MKFAFLTLDFRRFSLEFAFQCAARYGFDGVEIWGGRPHAWPDDLSAEDLRQIKSWRKKYHLEIPMFCPEGLNQNRRLTALASKERLEAVEFIKRNIDVARELEVPRVIVIADHPGYNVDIDDVWAAFTDSLLRLSDYAQGTGVRLTVEPLTPMESPVITRADDCVRLLRALQRDNIHFMMDIVPPWIAHEPYSDYFTKLGDRMDYIHISNNDGRTDAHNRLDNGVIPIEDMFAVFKNHGYSGWVSAELYSEAFHDPEMVLANTARILQRIRGRLEI